MMRDQELLKILEVREKKMDKELEASLKYREKLWTESLDMVNSNMIKMYNAQGEFEGALNLIGGSQNELIRTNVRMLEWMTNQLQGDRIAERPQPSISDSTPSNVGYQYEPVNLKSSKSHRK